jgi:hypothetical protein
MFWTGHHETLAMIPLLRGSPFALPDTGPDGKRKGSGVPVTFNGARIFVAQMVRRVRLDGIEMMADKRPAKLEAVATSDEFSLIYLPVLRPPE